MAGESHPMGHGEAAGSATAAAMLLGAEPNVVAGTTTSAPADGTYKITTKSDRLQNTGLKSDWQDHQI